MHRGYVTIHRKILDNPVVFKDADHLSVWIYLMLNATHRNYQAMFKGASITLLPGQLITGRLSIAKKLKISDSKVKRILFLFKSEQLIDQQPTNQNSLITLVSWGKYQNSDQQNDQQVTSDRPAGDQRVTTNNNIITEEHKKQKSKSEDFEKFWSECPNKKSKAAAEKAFDRAVKNGVSVDVLIDGMARYSESVSGTDKKFIKHPSTWLNAGCWQDEDCEPKQPKFKPFSADPYIYSDDGWTNEKYSEIEEQLFREGKIDENGNTINNNKQNT